jgi:hypothetical protein
MRMEADDSEPQAEGSVSTANVGPIAFRVLTVLIGVLVPLSLFLVSQPSNALSISAMTFGQDGNNFVVEIPVLSASGSSHTIEDLQITSFAQYLQNPLPKGARCLNELESESAVPSVAVPRHPMSPKRVPIVVTFKKSDEPATTNAKATYRAGCGTEELDFGLPINTDIDAHGNLRLNVSLPRVPLESATRATNALFPSERARLAGPFAFGWFGVRIRLENGTVAEESCAVGRVHGERPGCSSWFRTPG